MRMRSGDASDIDETPNDEFWRKNLIYLTIKNEILFLKNHENNELIIAPGHMRSKICAMFHDEITGGHLGFERTFRAIASRFYWPKMRSFIFDYCASCDVCQKFKSKHLAGVWPLVSIKVGKPWDLVGIDFAGPLKTTSRGNKYFIIAIDYCSKLIMARATSDTTAMTTIAFVKEDIINKFGVPAAILSDQGRNFEAKEFNAFCVENGIKKIRTTPYHPQCNGLAERSVKTNVSDVCER